MKKISTLLLIATLVLTMSCNSKTKEAPAVVEETTAEATSPFEDKTYAVSNSESTVTWEGYGIGKSHNGTVNVVAGKFEIANGALSIGKMTIDMSSLVALDLTDADKKGKLEGHLKDADFFNVAAFPTANIEVTDASNLSAVKANLTIKDKTNEIVFPAKLEMVDGAAVLTADLTIDRTKFGITYGSGNFFKDLGDKLIKDEFKIGVKLIAK